MMESRPEESTKFDPIRNQFRPLEVFLAKPEGANSSSSTLYQLSDLVSGLFDAAFSTLPSKKVTKVARNEGRVKNEGILALGAYSPFLRACPAYDAIQGPLPVV